MVAFRMSVRWSWPLNSDTITCMPLLTPDVVVAGTFGGTAQPTIPTGSGLVLRPWIQRDAPAVLEAFADPEIRRWHVRAAACRNEVERWIDCWGADWRGELHAHWAIADAVTDDLLGRVSLKNMDLMCGQGSVAYWTMPTRRGQDVASSAVEALTHWAFDGVGFHRLELTRSVHNLPSCRVAIKTGFDFEGVKRRAGLHLDGWHDMHLHARINDD
jgi:RimJ/RimL family protein N-acetyltransferase